MDHVKELTQIDYLLDYGCIPSGPRGWKDPNAVVHTIDIDLASNFAKQAHDKLGDIAAVNDTYGWILLKKGNKKKGLELLTKAHESEPDVNEIKYHYAIALYETGNKKEAKVLLSQLKSDKGNFEGKGDIDKYLN